MVIGVMSDTHGNRKLMHAVADLLTGKLRAELIFHLGDDYRDAVELADVGHPMRMVPGLWCPEYHDSRIPKRLVEDVAGVSIACAHAERDLRALNLAAAIILTGHTHVPRIEQIGFSLYVNPGHLKSSSDRNHPPTFATLLLEPEKVTVQIFDTDVHVLLHHTVSRDKLA